MGHKETFIPVLGEGASDEEVVRWTKRYDVFDRLDAGVSELAERIIRILIGSCRRPCFSRMKASYGEED